MGFRAFLVMDNKVARQAMAGNGGKWQEIEVRLKKDDICQKMAGNRFPRVSRHGHRGGQEDHSRNGRKWRKRISAVIW